MFVTDKFINIKCTKCHLYYQQFKVAGGKLKDQVVIDPETGKYRMKDQPGPILR